MFSEKRLWFKHAFSVDDPTIIQLFLVSKILVILLITLPELATSSLLNINVDYLCNDINGNQSHSIDVTWIVFTTTGLILLQLFMMPTKQPKQPGYVIFCVISSVFYFIVNINVIQYHCGGPSDGFTLFVLSTVFELIIISAVMSNQFKQRVKSDDDLGYSNNV